MNLFRSGKFKLHSGELTSWKIACNALGPGDWATLAKIASEILPPFGSVEGVPTGGLKFAEALQPHCTKGGCLLLVDDVSTTGRSMNEFLGDRKARGCVVFCRGVCPPWVIPLFKMPESYRDQTTAMPYRNPSGNRWLDKDLIELPSPPWLRAINALERANIKTVADLVEKQPEDLLMIPRFGEGSLNNVREVLEEINLTLKNDSKVYA